MITRRSFLLGAAGTAITPHLALQPNDEGGETPRRSVNSPHQSVSKGYPYDEPIPTLKSAVMTPLPDRVVAGYWTYWGSPIRLTDIPAGYNTVFLFHATPVGGAPGTTGAVQWNTPGNGRGAATNFKADLADLRKTRTAILTVGGARANVDLSTRARARVFLDSIKRIYGELGGFDGLDWNNYEGEHQPNTEQMIWISHQLKAAYGPTFAITTPPAPWRRADMTLCKAMIDEGVMDMISPQYYDGPDVAAESYIVKSVNEWVERMGDASRVGVGFGLANSVNYSTLADVKGAWSTLAASHPQLRGAYNWDIPTDESMGWQFAKEVGPLVLIRDIATPMTVPPVIPMLAPLAAIQFPGTKRITPSAADPTIPSVSRLPDHLVGTYWFPDSGTRLNALPADYNVIWVDFSEAGGSGGNVEPDRNAAPDMATFTADMAELRQRISPPRINLSGFGRPNSGVDLASTVGPDEFAIDVIRFAKAYGFDGYNWHLEHTPTFSMDSLERASRTIVTEMRGTNPSFSLTVTFPLRPSPDITRSMNSPVYTDFVSRCKDILDLVQQEYRIRNSRGLDIDHLRRAVQTWLDCGLRQDQIGFLWTTAPTAISASDKQLVMPTHVNQAWDALTETWPNLRGMASRSMPLVNDGAPFDPGQRMT